MLILNRNVGERFFIGSEVLIELLGFNDDGQTRIGILAPRHIEIYREELYQRKFKTQHPLSFGLQLLPN